MIVSVSRRTDIPSFYSDWFLSRVKEGFVYVRNPMNFHQVSKVNLSPGVVDGFVFWTKNPLPMINRLDELDEYIYYFQFTITPYGADIEPFLPHKNPDILETFKHLADIIGPDRVIWRYDPVFINNKYTYDFHITAFDKIATTLKDYTKKVTFSFIDTEYRGVKGNLKGLALQEFPTEVKIKLAAQLAEIARNNGITIETCAEGMDLSKFGIGQSRCIDDRLFNKLLNCNLDIDKDKNQRLACGCVTSIDIGMYNTCKNGCLYCYANYSKNSVAGNFANHDLNSPFISGNICEGDKIRERGIKSNRKTQIGLFSGLWLY